MGFAFLLMHIPFYFLLVHRWVSCADKQGFACLQMHIPFFACSYKLQIHLYAPMPTCQISMNALCPLFLIQVWNPLKHLTVTSIKRRRRHLSNGVVCTPLRQQHFVRWQIIFQLPCPNISGESAKSGSCQPQKVQAFHAAATAGPILAMQSQFNPGFAFTHATMHFFRGEVVRA